MSHHDFISKADDLSRRMAASTAEHKALQTGKSHTVARQSRPRKYLVFDTTDLALNRDDLLPFYEFTPQGACVWLGISGSVSEFIKRGRAAQAAVDAILAAEASRQKS